MCWDSAAEVVLGDLDTTVIHTAAVFTDSKMTNSSHDQAPATPSYFNVCQGSSSEAGSGTSSCESHEAERRHTDNETEDSEDTGEVGDVDTIRRRHKPDRPPRTIDTQAAPPSLEYYNLVHPAPAPAPALPRRAPYISHGAATETTASVVPSTCDLGNCDNR